MNTADAFKILKLTIQQNYTLIIGALTGMFLSLLVTGYLPNMFLNILFIIGLLGDTILAISNHQSAKVLDIEPILLLKSWTILGSVIVADYVICTIFNSTIINILLNMLKLIAFTTLYKYLAMIYDVYFAVFADKIIIFINENIVNNDRAKSLNDNKKYNLLNYMKSFIWTPNYKKDD